MPAEPVPPTRELPDPSACCNSGPPIGRRRLLQAAGASATALGLGMLRARPAAAHSDNRPPVPRSGLQVVLLGTEAGPQPVPGRAGISTAVVVDGATYLVDCGRSSVTQYQHAGLRFADLHGIFLTHLHADHVCDYYNYPLLAGMRGLGDQIPTGVPVYGPGRAAALPPASGGTPVPTINPANPTTGLADLTDSCHAAFAYSSNVFLRGAPSQVRDIRSLIAVHEITPPTAGTDPLHETAPPMQPFPVMEDDRVRVTAILVPHGNVFPAFAFRFDTDHGSVTLSGDTRYSDNVITLGQNSDLLVHEAISLPPSGLPAEAVTYQLSLHTLVDQVGQVAQRAGVPRLALTHLVDYATLAAPLDRNAWRRRAAAGYDGRVTVGQDLMVIGTRTRTHRGPARGA